MNVLIIHQYFLDNNDSGGSRMNELAKVLEKRGHNVKVIAGGVHYAAGKPYEYMKNKKWVKRKISNNIELFRVKVSDKYNKSFFGRLKAYTEFSFRASVRALKIKNIDVVLTTSPPLFVGIPGRIAKILKKAKWIFEVRDLWPEFAVSTGVLNNKLLIKSSYKFEKSVYKKCDKLVLLTPAFEKDVKSRYKFVNGKTKIVTNAADLNYIGPDEKLRILKRKELGFDNKFVFMYTGAHGLANGLHQVIEGAYLVKDRKDVLFVLIGSGMMKPKLIEQTKKLKLENVMFIDPVPKEKINEYLNAADVCMSILMPNRSFEKVYPNKVFDYMACSKPILNNIKGQTEELVKNANCGITVEPGNSEKFVKAVNEMLNSKKLEELGKNGFSYVKKHFDRANIMNEYVELIENLVMEDSYETK